MDSPYRGNYLAWSAVFLQRRKRAVSEVARPVEQRQSGSRANDASAMVVPLVRRSSRSCGIPLLHDSGEN